MCCKENPDLYNSLIVDLQGFSDMKNRSHIEVLSVVQIQSERLSKLLTCYLASKYDMTHFGELMYSIISPSQLNHMGTINSENQNTNMRQKSFSFEGSSGQAINQYGNNFSSAQNKGLFVKQVSEIHSAPQTNPFLLGQTSTPTNKIQVESDRESSQEDHFNNQNQNIERVSSYQDQSREEESPRSPLKLEEVRLCNEMIDRLRAECQEYELTIVEQDREIAQLREIVNNIQQNNKATNQKVISEKNYYDMQESQSLIQRLQHDLRNQKLENEQRNNQLLESSQIIMSLQEQLREQKQLNSDPYNRKNEIRKETEILMQQRELQSLQTEHVHLKQRFSEMQAILKQKEIQIIEVEKQAQQTLQSAQTDAEECIKYFKSIALQAKGKNFTTMSPDQNQNLIKYGQNMFPVSLAPQINESQQIQKSLMSNNRDEDLFVQNYIGKIQSRAKSASNNNKSSRIINKEDFSFNMMQNDFEISNNISHFKLQNTEIHENRQTLVLVVIEAMAKAFEEVSITKQGILYQVTQFRDMYCDQIKQFSVISYDYIEKLQNYIQNQEALTQELQNQSVVVQDLKQVTLQQIKHIKAQHELILAQKDKIQMFTEFMDKSLKRKEKEFSSFSKYALTELPLLSESIVQATYHVQQVKMNEIDQQNEFQELLQVHDMTKTKVRLLQEELEKVLKQNQSYENLIQEAQTKYERLCGLVQDVWIAEIKEFKQGNTNQADQNKQFSFVRRSDQCRFEGESSGNSDVQSTEMQIPMPVNWLSEIRDTLKQLRETSDFQKDECFQMLQMINNSVHNDLEQPTETDYQHTYQLSDDLDDNSSKGIDDIGSEGALSNQNKNEKVSTRKNQKYQSTFRSRNDAMSPRINSKNSKSINSNRVQNQNINDRQELNDRQIRSNSADHRGIISQRTPKNVRFNQPVLAGSIRSLGAPALSNNQTRTLLSSGGGSNNGNNRNELQQMLRDEIYKLKRDHQVSRETIIQMQNEIKALKRDMHDLNCDNDETNQELQNQHHRADQAENELKSAQNQIELFQNSLKQREETIENLKNQIDDFESELTDLQSSMQNVVQINNQISQQSEQLELLNSQTKEEIIQLKSQYEDKLRNLVEANDEKIKSYKKKILSKEAEILEITNQLNSEKEINHNYQQQRQNVKDQATETNDYIQEVEKENSTLRTQLQSVKQDVSAVLEQYDKQSAINKQVKKKVEKLKLTNQQQTQSLNQCRKDLETACNQLQQIQIENQQLQQHYQNELQNEQRVNEQLQIQIEEVTQLAEELQSQVIGSTNDNEEMKIQNQTNAETVKQLEARIREMLSDSHSDKQTIQKQREKIAMLKRQRTHSRQNYHGLSQIQSQNVAARLPSGNPRITVSQNSQEECNFSSDSPSQRSEFTSQVRGGQNRVYNDQQNQLADQDRNNFRRATSRGAQNNSYNNSQQQQNGTSAAQEKIKQKHTCNFNKSPATQNPFSNISNMSGAFDSLRMTQDDRATSALNSCCCGNNVCVGSQYSKPSFFQPGVITVGHTIQDQQTYQELKWKADSKQIAKFKVNKVVKYIEDLIKSHCRQLIETNSNRTANQDRADQNNHSYRNFNLNKHVQEWSAEQILDCWATEDSAIIEAKAYFNKHSPVVMTCLKLLVENNVQIIKEQINKNHSQTQLHATVYNSSQRKLKQNPTMLSSQFQTAKPPSNGLESQRSSNRSNQQFDLLKSNQQQKDMYEAYELLASHCQYLLQSYLQVGRSLAGICFGGCILVGQNFTSDIKDNVDFALKFLSQETTLLDSTNGGTIQDINKVVEHLLTCLQQIVKTSCQVILNRSSISKSDANKMLESIHQSCDFTGILQRTGGGNSSSCHTKSNSNFGVQVNQHTFDQTFAQNSSRRQLEEKTQKEVRDKLVEVENRIKSKFQHVSKLEASLDKLLSNQQKPETKSQNLNDTSHQSISSGNSSVLSDTKTVMQLISTVKRVVSKLKIELHQDYLQLGNINVGLLRTPSLSSYTMSQGTNEAQVQGVISTPKLNDQASLEKENLKSNCGVGSSTEAKRTRDVLLKVEMEKIIDDMSGLTFEETIPLTKKRQTQSHQDALI